MFSMCKIKILYSVELIKTVHFTEVLQNTGLNMHCGNFLKHVYYDYFFTLESLFRALRYWRPLARFSRPAPLVVTNDGRAFSGRGAESVPFLSGGCPSSPSPSWRRFLVSARELRGFVLVQLHWMTSFLTESTWALWKFVIKKIK